MVREYVEAGVERLHGAGLRLFTKSELKEIHSATMDVLMDPGVLVTDPAGRELFEKNGCEVDHKTEMVRIPEYVVRKALQTAPSRFTLAGRIKENDVLQEAGGKVYWTTFGTGVQVLKFENGKPVVKDSTEADIAETAIITDWCENVAYFSLTVSARDWSGKGAQDVHETFASIKNTSKHFQHIDPVGTNVDTYWELAKAFYGGDEEMARRRPLISLLLCPTSPLQLHTNAVQVIINGAKYGMPVNVLSMAMAGATSPVHLAGTLVTHNAEVLAGIVLSQLAKPGAPVWYGSSTTMLDLRRGTAPVGAPELGLISAAVAQLAQYYGLPSFVAGI
ncbi:MAG: Trimethylamine methyltransferase [Euryarchaeota archaeon 55_53]|nr:MAG: Trimethylamine methyltransferase [Euryarchaeota archaeon 55_53]